VMLKGNHLSREKEKGTKNYESHKKKWFSKRTGTLGEKNPWKKCGKDCIKRESVDNSQRKK